MERAFRDLTVAEAAEIINVSSKTVRRWIAQGRLPAYRVGPVLIRIRSSDLDRVARRIPAGGSS